MHIRLQVSIACSVGVLLGCSTPHPTIAEREAPTYQLAYRTPPETRLLPAQPCYVGTNTCVDLDSRPFAPCLLTDRHCSPDAEFMALDSDNMTRVIVWKPHAIEPTKNRR